MQQGGQIGDLRRRLDQSDADRRDKDRQLTAVLTDKSIWQSCWRSGASAACGCPRGIPYSAFANASSTSPWQASGAHQQSRSLPCSSDSAPISAECPSSHRRYIATVSARCSLLALRGSRNGLPHLLLRQPV